MNFTIHLNKPIKRTNYIPLSPSLWLLSRTGYDRINTHVCLETRACHSRPKESLCTLIHLMPVPYRLVPPSGQASLINSQGWRYEGLRFISVLNTFFISIVILYNSINKVFNLTISRAALLNIIILSMLNSEYYHSINAK